GALPDAGRADRSGLVRQAGHLDYAGDADQRRRARVPLPPGVVRRRRQRLLRVGVLGHARGGERVLPRVGDRGRARRGRRLPGWRDRPRPARAGATYIVMSRPTPAARAASRTSPAAAASWAAMPTDLYSVIWSGEDRPGRVPASSSPSSA